MTHTLLDPRRNWDKVVAWNSSEQARAMKRAAIVAICEIRASLYNLSTEDYQRCLDLCLSALVTNDYRMFFANPSTWVEGTYRKPRRNSPMEFFMPGACHSLVRIQKKLAQLTHPKVKWKIRRGKLHSAVFGDNGEIFDILSWYFGLSGERAYDWVVNCIPSNSNTSRCAERRGLL